MFNLSLDHRSCEELKRAAAERLDRDRACFETRPIGAPQHEAILGWDGENLVILRRPRSGRLEGRTGVYPAVLQFWADGQLPKPGGSPAADAPQKRPTHAVKCGL